ncbi:MAG: hypothetical protein ABR562_06470 [Thermoplasmatota archaeon]
MTVDERDEASRAAVRSAQLSIILMVAAAVSLTIGAVTGLWIVAILAGFVGFVGVGLLFLTGLQSGRKDAPKP